MKTKKLWYKHWWAITLLIIIGLVIIGNLFGWNNSSNSSSNSNNLLSAGNSGNCPKELVPERIKLNCTEYELCKNNDNVSGVWCSCKYLENEEYKWKDGTEISKANNINFGKTMKTGENVNYLYSWSYAMYDKPVINSDGTIGKTIQYGMFLAIDPKDKTDEGYKIVEYKCVKAYSKWIKI